MTLLFAVTTLLLAAAASAQDSTAPPDGWWDKVKDKVSAVVGGASDLCSNPYVSGPYLEKVFCDKIIPDQYTQKINNITFGADTDWCRGLACVYRAAGCVDPTYRIEAKVIAATGKAEQCAETVGLDPAKCNLLAKFIAAPPMAQQKRSAEEEEREAVRLAAHAAMLIAPHTPGLEAFLGTAEERKRDDIGATLLSQLQVCSPLIAAGLKVIEAQVKLPVNISDALGPCGTICGYAICGLNILCQDTAAPLLAKINSDRMYNSCPVLACAKFSPKGIDVCGNATCPNPEGYWQSNSNCLPPKRVHNPTKQDVNDCCQRCDDKCNGVRCPAVNCPEPEYPLCTAYQVSKYDQFDCCQQCIDPCNGKKAACAAPPSSCPAGQTLGPAYIGDCCLSCQPACAGVSCSASPQSAKDCPAGQVWQDRPATPTRCGDCCPKCVAKDVVDKQISTGVRSFVLAVAAGAVAVAAML